MSRLEQFVTLAKQQLPAAFTAGAPLPFSDRQKRLIAKEGAALTPNRVGEDLLPTGDEDLRDFERANQELGFDAMAFYISFHRPSPDGQWGIFYWDHRVRQLAEKIRQDLELQNAHQAGIVALEILRRHEAFHFRFDAYSLNQELTLHKPLYNRYIMNVYRSVLCTAECYEEALANRACVFSSYEARAGPLGHPVKDFVTRLCEKAPAGYRDFARPEGQLQTGLGGQLFSGTNSAVLSEPQSWCVGQPVPAWRVSSCPEYLLINRTSHAGEVLQLRVKLGGRVWDFHKNDPDPWPSDRHGHDQDGYKLDVSDGKIYDPRSKRPVDKESPKRLQELRDRLEQQWPGKVLPPMTG